MKKYFIVLILGLLIGMLFAKSVYGQENYFTPMTALQASKENNSESKKESSKGKEVKESHKFYYKQFTYPYYLESLHDFDTKYVLYLRSTQYEDVEVNLIYIQPYFMYSDMKNTATSILNLLTCIQDNVEQLQDTIDYCNLCGYDESVVAALTEFIIYFVRIHDYIKECALKYIDYHTQEDFASCIKQLILIENYYWEFFTAIGDIENPDGINTITIRSEPVHES